MPAASKNTTASKDRRRSATTPTPANGPSLIVTLKTTPEKLRAIVDPTSIVKEDTPVKEVKESPATSATLPAAAISNNENASDSNPDTPAVGTPAEQNPAMAPPAEGLKKKGVKRSAGAANGNGEPKIRGKPGPKKKLRLDDGTLEGGRGSLGAHKLGPKANQGAINAGLRALDRSGKPCRKWAKGGFTLKSFTGVVWEVSRWTAPPKPQPEDSAADSTPASAEGSNKENKENNSHVKSENSNNGGDVEMQSRAPSVVAPSSPAPIAAAAA